MVRMPAFARAADTLEASGATSSVLVVLLFSMRHVNGGSFRRVTRSSLWLWAAPKEQRYWTPHKIHSLANWIHNHLQRLQHVIWVSIASLRSACFIDVSPPNRGGTIASARFQHDERHRSLVSDDAAAVL